ncbi:MAG: YwaF family protein [Clostridia bacterium]|nr:YwaF family protein [Clostridia bacterium]
MKEFLSGSGEAQGAYSWQHLTFVTTLMVIMVLAAIFLGKRYKKQEYKAKNRVMIWAAILIDGFELAKIIIGCSLEGSIEPLRRMLPLFLCSIQLIAIPLAAFSKGKLKNASLDFVLIFGILGAVMGTYGAAQNYSAYPVLSWPNIVSGITHSISGFASLYILFSGMASMKKGNILICLGILTSFCVLAYVANVTLDYNYMFLMRGDGTPYDIFFNLVNGHPVFYPLIVVGLFFVYILAFYAIYGLIAGKKQRTAKAEDAPTCTPVAAVAVADAEEDAATKDEGKEDAFLSTLSEQEKEQFLQLLSQDLDVQLPEYEIGGENKLFFRQIFVKLGSLRDKIPNGLMEKIYQFTIQQ